LDVLLAQDERQPAQVLRPESQAIEGEQHGGLTTWRTSFIAFIDEAGDEGFKFKDWPERASSEWFVLAACIVREGIDPQRCGRSSARSIPLRRIGRTVESQFFTDEANSYIREHGIGWQLTEGQVEVRGAESFEDTVRGAHLAL